MNASASWPARSRLASVVSGLVVNWFVWMYTADGSRVLLGFTFFTSLIAVLFPRYVLRTTRAVIWTGVFLLILGLAANIERITPDPNSQHFMRVFFYDRAVTVTLVVALLALFMPAGRAAGTMLMAGCLPLWILTLSLDTLMPPDRNAQIALIVAGMMILLLSGQLHALLRMRSAGSSAIGIREIVARISLLGAFAMLSALLCFPSAFAIEHSVRWVSSMSFANRFQQRDQGGMHLSLSAPPGGFISNTRPVLSIQSPVPPGYLRQQVYRDFLNNATWAPRPFATVHVQLPRQSATSGSTHGFTTYRMTKPPQGDPADAVWFIRHLETPRRLGIVLPQRARSIRLAEPQEIAMNGDDAVYWQRGFAPSTYAVAVDADELRQRSSVALAVDGPVEPRFPLLTGMTAPEEVVDPLHRVVPKKWTDETAKWAEAVEGLAGASNAFAAMHAVIEHFHRNFSYRLEGPPGGSSGDLRAFMSTRQGHCTLFATAGTLMLRHAGVPARMVSGYLATDRHPITGEWVVRARDAHAWVEAWDDDAGGWRRLEPTVGGGLPTGLPSPARWQLWVEAASLGIRNFIDQARNSNPLTWLAEFIARVYVVVVPWITSRAGIWTMIIASFAFGYIRWQQVRRLRASDPDGFLRIRLERAMRVAAMRSLPADQRRQPAETWHEWQARISPDLPSGHRQQLDRLIEDYQQVRFGSPLSPERIRKWMQANR